MQFQTPINRVIINFKNFNFIEKKNQFFFSLFVCFVNNLDAIGIYTTKENSVKPKRMFI